MLITVAIATYDRPRLLREAIDSVVAQTYPNWELVVVDDGSSPAVEQGVLAGRVADRLRIVRHEVAQGVAAAKNAGLHAASGDVILHLDDDDLLEHNTLEVVASLFTKHPELDCVFLNTRPFGKFAEGASQNQQQALKRLIAQAAEGEDDELIYFGPHAFDALLKSVPLPMQRPAARRGAWNMVGDLTTGLLFSEPDWTIRASMRCRMALTKAQLSLWRVDGQNFASRPEAFGKALDNGIEATRKLLERLEAERRRATLQVKSVNSRLAQAHFDKAYYIWDQYKRTDWRSIGSSLRTAPSWRPIHFVLRNLALRLGIRRA